MRVLVLLISLLTISNVFAKNIALTKMRQLDVVSAYDVKVSDVYCIKSFNNELIRVNDHRAVQLGETEKIDGYELRLIDKVFIKYTIRKMEKNLRASRRRSGNGSGGSH